MAEQKAKTLPCGISEAQLKQWKNEHGEDNIHVVEVPRIDDEGTGNYEGIFRKPDMSIISAASKYAESDPIKAGEILYENCKLKVDPEMDAKPEIKASTFAQLMKMFKVREAKIKKL